MFHFIASMVSDGIAVKTAMVWFRKLRWLECLFVETRLDMMLVPSLSEVTSFLSLN